MAGGGLHCDEGRLPEDHVALLEAIPSVPNLQSAWLLLLNCASPRANYYLRVLPPSQSAGFAAAHDENIEQCLRRLLALEGGDWQNALPKEIAKLPLRMGGLGLRSAARSSTAAYWACLPMIRARHPGLAAGLVQALEDGGPNLATCLGELRGARQQLVAEGFEACPDWRSK